MLARKKIRLDPSSVPEEAVQTTDWSLCTLCQKSMSEALRNPSKCKNESPSKGYGTLAVNLRSLDDLSSLPLSIKISRLDDGRGIEETLMQHNAKWHKTCYVMCSKDKVNRIRKKIVKQQAPAITLPPNTSPLKNRLQGALPCISK